MATDPGTPGIMTEDTGAPTRLAAHVPRIAAEWSLDAPGSSWQVIDATLTFVDLSGFTRLSERLAERGRIGAEQLTEILNGAFGSMLELAYRRGGNLVKFGGDALLLLFRGPDHAVRACCAAVELRSALRAESQATTLLGRTGLRMSVGVHSGPLDLFLVGDSHRELIVCGPSASTTTLMEQAAGPGEIVVSASTAAALPDSATRPNGDVGRLLRWRKAPVPSGEPEPRRWVDAAVIESCLPPVLRRHLGSGPVESEHRTATVGFVRFSGVDGLLAREGHDAVADALRYLVGRAQQATETEEIAFLASDIDRDGGKLILGAGVPVAREDDPGRLLRVLRHVVDGRCPLEIRAGANRGHVFTGEVGNPHRRTFTVMGDTVNLAARLMAAAAPGALYTTGGTLDSSRSLFETTPLQPLRLKGKAQPVTGFEVGRETGSRPATSGMGLPFTGRASELETLATAVTGNRGVVDVVAEGGLGKTRLIEEALARADGLWQLAVRGEPQATGTPYRALRDPLRALLGIERDRTEVMARALAAAVATLHPGLLPRLPLLGDAVQVPVPDTEVTAAIEPRFRGDRVADAVLAVLAAARPEPGVLVVEDAQWIDEASARTLSVLAASTAHRPWLMVVARRPDPGGFHPPETATSVELAPLTDAEVEHLIIAATEATPLRPHQVSALVERAGGSPFFLTELLRVSSGAPEDEVLPDSLEAAVRAHLDTMAPLARTVLGYVAVLGQSARSRVLEELLATDDVQLDEPTRTALHPYLEDDESGRLRFRQALLRDVVYETLTYRRRRSIHRRAAVIIERLAGGEPEAVSEALAYHYLLAQDHWPAWRYARIAGDRAKSAYANLDAAVSYERALEAARRLPGVTDRDLAAVWGALGDVRDRAGMFDGALDAYRRASRLQKDDPVATADLRFKRAHARERVGDYTLALREISLGFGELRSLDTPQATGARARLAALAATVRLAQERLRQAIRQANEAIPEAQRAGDRAALARAHETLHSAHGMLGHLDAGEHARRALAIYEELGDLGGQATVTGNMGAEAYFAGRWDEARAFYQRSREAALRSGNVVRAAIQGVNIGELLVNQGRCDEAEAVLAEAGRVLRASGFVDGAAVADIHLARALTHRGALDDAERLLEGAHRELAALGKGPSALEAAVHLSSVLVRTGRPDEALRLLQEAEEQAGDGAGVLAASLARARGEALAALGRTKDARSTFEAGVAVAEEQGLPYERALLLLAATALPGRSAGAEEAESVLRGLGVTEIPSPRP